MTRGIAMEKDAYRQASIAQYDDAQQKSTA